jgi:hypothetical protein
MMESETHFLGKKVVKLQASPLSRVPSQICGDVDRKAAPPINQTNGRRKYLPERLDGLRN